MRSRLYNRSTLSGLHWDGAWQGQIAVTAQSNEIPAVRELLSLLSLEGCTVTRDALHAQRETAQAVLDQGVDYILALKANQGTLYEEVRTLLNDLLNSCFVQQHRCVSKAA